MALMDEELPPAQLSEVDAAVVKLEKATLKKKWAS